MQLAVADLGVLEAAVESFDPHLVVSNHLNTVDPGGSATWYKLSHELEEASEVCLDARRTQSGRSRWTSSAPSPTRWRCPPRSTNRPRTARQGCPHYEHLSVPRKVA